ncbi:MAG: alanyl-tRNA editing protein [Faecalibacterium sp.]|nr:alanyl-tRNA editing protein [Faecalibacterium sp.]
MAATQKLYYEQPLARSFTARVCEVDPARARVALDATAFYPEGGGQPADRGVLHFAGADAAVLDVHEQAGVIWHQLDTLPPNAAAGDKVQGEVDWARRLDHMQQHTGEHILSGTLHRLFGAENVGFHIGTEAVRMDTDIPLSWQQLQLAEQQANAVIWADAPVNISWPEPAALAALTYRSKKELEGPVRIVEIPGGDCCACCGTHLAHAGQVGMIKILTAEHYKGGMRLSVVCGGRALQEYEAMRSRQQTIGALLSAKPEETAHAVQRLSDEKAALDYNYYGLCQQLFEQLAAQAAQTPNTPAIYTLPGLSPAWLARLANRLAAAVPNVVCAALSETDRGTGYCIASAAQDVRPLIKALNAAGTGRGGGKPGSCQGSCAGASPQQVEEFLRQTLQS